MLNTPALVKRHLETLARLRELCSGERPSVFDIGAGAGGFLVAARESGFEVAGNEISPPAIGAAKRQGIDLTFGDDLHAIAADAKYDAVTMWCILAHVDDPSALMHGIQDLLRPGGVLFFHTPRRCLVDGVALSLQRLTGGRYRKMFDRRINGIHRRQYSKKGLESFLRREGFEPILVEPVIAYGLRIEAYLTRIGIPRTISRPLGRILEKCGEVGLLPRNTLNVYARPSSMPRSLI